MSGSRPATPPLPPATSGSSAATAAADARPVSYSAFSAAAVAALGGAPAPMGAAVAAGDVQGASEISPAPVRAESAAPTGIGRFQVRTDTPSHTLMRTNNDAAHTHTHTH